MKSLGQKRPAGSHHARILRSRKRDHRWAIEATHRWAGRLRRAMMSSRPGGLPGSLDSGTPISSSVTSMTPSASFAPRSRPSRFAVRARPRSGSRWVHIGTDETDLALTEATATPAEAWVPYGAKPGLNHLGYEVSDAEAVRVRLKAAGYRDSTVPNQHPHRTRVYFHDSEGNDWEFVQYSSVDPAERNDYEIGDAIWRSAMVISWATWVMRSTRGRTGSGEWT